MSINQYILFFACLLLFSCEKQHAISNPASENFEIRYVDSIYDIRFKALNDSIGREKLFEVASEYENREVYIQSKQTLEEILKRAAKKKDTLHQAKVYWYLGNIYNSQQKLDTAFFYYTKSEKLYALNKKDSLNWARIISYKAGILYDYGLNRESEVELIKALQILDRLQNIRLIYEANLNLALNLKDIKEYDEAQKYYNKIPHLLKQLEGENYDEEKIKRSWLSYYNNMGSFYNETKEYSKAKNFLEKGLSTDNVEEFPKLKAMLLNNYAQNLMKTSKNNSLIDSLLNRSLKIREEIHHQQGIIGSKISIAEFLLTKRDTINALKSMKEGYHMAVKDLNHYSILKTLEFLSKNDYQNKEYYTQQYLSTKDSLYQKEKAIRNKFARIAYETEQIEEENILLTQRNQYLIVFALFGFIFAGILLIIFRLRAKNKELIYQQKEQNNMQQIQELILRQQIITSETKTREQDRIAKDLHDGVLNRLFTTRINLEELETDDPLRKKQLIEELQKTESQIREVSHNLHQNLFQQQQDFSLVVENLVLIQKNTFGTSFNCTINKKVKWENFNIRHKTNIYLIIQELLQNVNKHSNAEKCFVFILEKEDSLIIRVHDDGIGFKNNKGKTGLGLKSIKDRLSELKGYIEINSKFESTIVSIKIPIYIN